MKRGLEQGIQKEKVSTARHLILKGIDNKFIQEVTQLPIETIEHIRADVSK